MGDNSTEKSSSRAEQREAELLHAAIELFAEEGFGNVSTRKIAAQAGVSEGTLFHYFGSKNELMGAILGRFYGELTDNATRILREELDSRARLQLLAENHIGVLARDNSLFMRLIQTYRNADLSEFTKIQGSVLHKLNRSYAWVFDAAVKEAMTRGELRDDVNIPALRDLFFGGLEYCSRTMFLHESFDQMRERVASVVEPLWQSMLPQQPRVSEGDRLERVCERLEAVAGKLDSSQPASPVEFS